MTGPFPVDLDVMQRIRRMEPGDVPVVARMHRTSMGTTLWGRLGDRFLEHLYLGMLRDRSFLGFVYVEDGDVRGFIAGSEDVRGMMRRTLIRRGPRLIRPVVAGIARQPGLVRELVRTPAYFRVSDPAEDVPAESLFCCFAPALRGRRVSGHINKVLFDALAHRGHDRVKITTEISNEGAVRQLTRWGFQDRGRFEFYGKEMVTFVLDLHASPRVQPRQWVA